MLGKPRKYFIEPFPLAKNRMLIDRIEDMPVSAGVVFDHVHAESDGGV
jgi:hypothetical protein